MSELAAPPYAADALENHSPRNWSLLLGWALVVLITLAAIAGPWIAPHDPLERVSVLQVDGRWIGPPYPALTPGYPLGTDGAGRDLFSRLLWAVRPTMLMVVLIALLRLVIGVSVGVAAGWARGALAPWLDGLITFALLVPVLVVALAVIAFVGIQRGLLAFTIGLTLTGWAETARYVETQTRALRSQNFVEAARVLGGSGGLVIVNHVLRHLLPQLGMLLATEMGATLMTTAALGFLGYFVGGGVWITISDFGARNEAGLPELGQMLATSLERLLQPWAMIVVGGVVVIMILAFNLLGEGLRRRLDDRHGRSASVTERLVSRLAETLAVWESPQRAPANRRGALRATLGAAALLVVLGVGWRLFTAPTAAEPSGALAVPGNHPWATQRHDAAGTLTIAAAGPLTPTLRMQFSHTGELRGGPVVAADGTIYQNALDPALLAIDADGTLRWSAPLAAEPVGSPAISASGEILVVDYERGLSAFSAEGAPLWRTQMNDGPRPSSGPVVAADGHIYFSQAARVRALTGAGESLWLTAAGNNASENPPRVSPDGRWVFLQEKAFATANGAEGPPPPAVGGEFQIPLPGYVPGASGDVYFVAGSTAARLAWQEGAVQGVHTITLNVGGLNIYLPNDAGFSANGLFWLFYGTEYDYARLIFVDENSRLVRNVTAPLRGARLVGMDAGARAYLCGASGLPHCYAVSPEAAEPLWHFALPQGRNLAGGALLPGLLYVSTQDGNLYAIGDPP